ncbi:MerR family transcriptional regulator [Galbitalea soli]|uniref:MerR family transcriptional regulator n=1 Tax=Galbitalea soli TaxID=1268042 RepID=A0A7C9TPF6_9MICO|nr:MerR family transcriptional regulator [Galbitalea soli]NEM90259.1 MerR family transcriptional regulator [Galbitalea soli]NYJ30967.1 DNA-binding transcriptional MerR regulator [Galbitalea soli]
MSLLEAAGLSISEAAERTSLTVHTLRYYEREGLMLGPVDRSSSTHRRYSEADITWVVFLSRLRSTAMPIARIREYVALVRRGDDTTQERLALLTAHRQTVLATLDEVRTSLAAIDYKIAAYSKGNPVS